MFRRAIVAALTMALLVSGPFAAPSHADLGNEAFAADGTVVEANSPVGPTEVSGSAAFKLGPPSFTPSPTAASGVDNDGNLKIYVTPNTVYYKDTGGGAYVKSNYNATIVQNASIRVHGRRVVEQAGEFRFVATTIWNGPPAGGSGTGGSAPACGSSNALSNHAFRFVAVVGDRRVRIPCTNIGGQPGGFRLDPPEYVNPPIAQSGVAAYGGSPDIYVTPTTAYYLDGQASTFDGVVQTGLKVRADGRYVLTGGLWLFVATRIDRFTVEQPPPPFSEFNIQEDLDAAFTSGNAWQGTSRGGNVFGGGSVQSTLIWTSSVGGWSFSGTLELFNSVSGDRLNLNISGSVSGTSMTSAVTVTGGAGRFNNGSGSGTLNGLVGLNGTDHPKAFDAHLSVVVSVPN